MIGTDRNPILSDYRIDEPRLRQSHDNETVVEEITGPSEYNEIKTTVLRDIESLRKFPMLSVII